MTLQEEDQDFSDDEDYDEEHDSESDEDELTNIMPEEEAPQDDHQTQMGRQICPPSKYTDGTTSISVQALNSLKPEETLIVLQDRFPTWRS